MSFTDLFDQVQLNIPWRLREDLTVPAPHLITSPWATAQPATQATESPASSPQQLIRHTRDVRHPGCTQTETKGS